MQRFWDIVERWDGAGQGVFFLLLAGSFFSLLAALFHYIAVWLHGWPG